MMLTSGSRLGPYEILGPLGAGGMGEVYRAHDTRLQRTVAIKILPAHLSGRPAARERFEREARAISSLNHPNICQLYDVGTQDGNEFLVMEYLVGETLADRLRKGALPVEQVLRYGIDISEGLERAHRTGVVHRDLKPGNIMITKSGAKLMDFGLALPIAARVDPEMSALGTVSQPLTAEGTVVGTVQYMSPEQVEGREVGGPSDIFSLGAVLYEMITGRRAFEGKSQLSIASAILEKEPDSIRAHKPMTPPALEHAIRTCLAKDPEKRWQTGRDLAHALSAIAEGMSQSGVAAAHPGRAKYLEWLLRAGLIVLTGGFVATLFLALRPGVQQEQNTRVVRSWIKPMPDSSFLVTDGSGCALSPDGRSLAYVATTSTGKSHVWLRSMDSLQARSLPGTEDARYPFWSADSRRVAFFAGGKLKTVDTAGGNPFTVCDASEGRGGTWNRQGEILLAPSINSGLHKVPASGGTPVPVTTLDGIHTDISHRWPWFLPDGRHFIFLAGSSFTSTVNPTNTIMVGSLDSSEIKPLLKTHAGAIYASGRLIFLRQSTLMAQPFDLDSLELIGAPAAIADPVQEAELFAKGLFSASEDGQLAFVEGSPVSRQLVWYDRSGHQVAAVPGADAYASPHISPDGRRLLYYIDHAGFDIWTYDIARGVKTPQTFGSTSGQSNIFPVWSPDSSQFAYTTYRDGKYFLSRKLADGSSASEDLLPGADHYIFVSGWSPDGKTIAFHEGTQGGHAQWMLPLDGTRKPYRFMEAQLSTREATFSPDGRWVAYVSNESGEYRVYVVPFPGPGGKWQVSVGGGTTPRWRRDGKEIYYFSSDNRVMAAEVSMREKAVEIGAARPLFETRVYGVFGVFDVTADGQRFLVPHEPGQSSTAIALVTNWPAGLSR